MRLSLPDVTLVAIDQGPVAELQELAVRDCLAVADFAAVIRDVGPIDNVLAWDRASWYDVPPLVKTTHYLMIQWDSWIINPAAWSDEFLGYDYIGAPWWYGDGRNVGNAGFSLRSTRLGHYLADNRDKFPLLQLPIDDRICRLYRPLMRGDLLWAPDDVAWRFARERTGWERPQPSFGFHGLWNFPRVLDLARLGERIALFNDYVTSRVEYPQMLAVMMGLAGRRLPV